MKKKKFYATIILLSFLTLGIQSTFADIYIPNDNGDYYDIVDGIYVLNQEVDDTINISQDNITLDGGAITIKPVSNNTTGIHVGSKSGVTIQNVTIMKNDVGEGFDIGIRIQGSDNITLRGNTISGCDVGPNSAGIDLNLTYECDLTNNIVSNNSYGIRIAANYSNVDVGNTLITNNISNNNVWGIYVTDSHYHELTGNNITGNAGGIWLQSSNFNSLEGNTVTGHSASGIYLSALNNNPSAPSTDNILEGNNSTNNRDGIFLNIADNNIVTGNTCSNNEYGIRLWDSNNNTLINNTISGNTLDGIYLDPSNNNTITNNDIENNDRGIYIRDSSNNIVKNNTISSNDWGIQIIAYNGESSTDNQIYNNNFENENIPEQQAKMYVEGTGDVTGTVFNLAEPIGGNYWSDWSGSGAYTFTGGQDEYPWSTQDGWLPAANAGADQTIECACKQGGTEVTLDGTSSTGASTYTWTGPFLESPVSGSNPTVTLDPGCLGEYEITLVINNGELETETDTVIITVVDTTPPDISCPGDISVEAMGPEGVPKEGDRIQAFLGGASASDNCDPEPSITNDAPDVFPPGEVTTVTFTATDALGNTSTCFSSVTVVEAEESNLRIIPRIINRDGRLEQILAVIRFPAGTDVEDLDIDTPLVLYPGESPIGIEATSQRIVTWCRWGTLRVAVFARFPKDDVTAGVPENGPAEMMVIGRFTSGQYFYGFDNVWICSWNW